MMIVVGLQSLSTREKMKPVYEETCLGAQLVAEQMGEQMKFSIQDYL